MEGVILCAGDGTRLQPVTTDTPKPLVEVAGKPLLEHSLEYAATVGVTQLHLVVGYYRNQIINRYGSSYNGIPITYHIQEKRNGLAHALNQVDTDFTSPFLLLLSDVIYGDFPAEELPTDKPTLVIDTVPFDEASQYGVCELSETGDIKTLIEKPANPPTNKILAGAYVLPPDILNYYDSLTPSARGEYELTDIINAYLTETNTTANLVEINSWRVDIAHPHDIRTVHKHTGRTQQNNDN